MNARNFFAAANAVTPQFRRNQFGGVIGGPIRRDQTFFFFDYQGQRQTIGRTVISTVPTALQRQGIFTEAIGGRVPVIYDPATTTPVAGGGVTRAQFAGNAIPAGRIDSVARTLLDRYPLPTSAGTANNYRRLANETVDQDQFSMRLDHRFPSNRDHVFGRLTRFEEQFEPVTPLPDGSGPTTGTLGPPEHHLLVVCLQLSAQVLEQRAERASIRRHQADRPPGRRVAGRHGVGRAGIARHSVQCPVPGHAADLRHRRLHPAGLAGQHGLRLRHQRHAGRRFVHLAEGPSHAEDGRRPAVGTAGRRAAAVANRLLHVLEPVQRPAWCDQHRHAVRKLPAGPGAALLDRSPAGGDQEPGPLPGVLPPGRLAHLRSPDRERGPALHPELPVHGRERPGGGVQPGDAPARVPGARRESPRCPPAAQAESGATPGHRRAGHGQDRGPRRLRHGVDRDGGHHHAVHHTGVSFPPDRHPADARQHYAGVHACRGASASNRFR